MIASGGGGSEKEKKKEEGKEEELSLILAPWRFRPEPQEKGKTTREGKEGRKDRSRHPPFSLIQFDDPRES